MKNEEQDKSQFSRKYSWYVLTLLTLTHFINYVDRQIIGSVLPFLEKSLDINKFEQGLLVTAFTIVLSILSIPSGILSDKWVRKNVVTIGLFVWSVATALAGFAKNFAQLFMSRAFVGVGEAAYTPAANTLISDYFPENVRARVISIFNIGMFAGGAIGLAIGPVLAVRVGWEYTFMIVGVPGIILGILTWFVREPPQQKKSEKISFRILLSNRVLQIICIGGTCFSFIIGAVITWITSFTLQVSPYKCINPLEPKPAEVDIATYTVLLPALISGLAGTVISGFVADKMKEKWVQGRALTIGIALIIAIPFLLITIYTDSKWVYLTGICVSVFFISSYTGPVIALIFEVVDQHVRGTAVAVYTFLIHILGDSLSPPLIGWITEVTDDFKLSFASISLVCLLGGLSFIWAGKELKKYKQDENAWR